MKGKCLNTGRTHFKKGYTPWNKGLKDIMKPNKTSFKKGQVPWNKFYKEPEIRNCENCNNEFDVSKKWQLNQKFCSRDCKNKFPKSKETKKLISKKLKGNIIPIDVRRKISNTHIKKLGFTKRGYFKKHREDVDYRLWREKILNKFNSTCVISGETKNICTHHLINYRTSKENALDVNNGVVISKKHHYDFHKKYGFYDNNEEQFINYFGEKLLEKYVARNVDTLAGTDLVIVVSVA